MSNPEIPDMSRELSEALRPHEGPLQSEAPVRFLPYPSGLLPEGKRQLDNERRQRAGEGAREVMRVLGLREALEHARVDAVTGLPNRLAFEGEFPSIYSRAAQNEIAMLYIDLNGLKRVNDRLGHEAGDRYLRAMADTLKQSIRPTDRPYKLGGDEIGVLLLGKKSGDEGQELVTQRIREQAAQAIHGLGFPQDLYLGLSIGAAAKRQGESARDFMARADAASYEDKQAFYDEIKARTGRDLRR